MSFLFFFFFNDTATTEIYTLSLHDALPITTIRLTQAGKDRVRFAGIKGRPATDKLKVSLAYFYGYKAVGTLVYAWPDAYQKAQAAERGLRRRLQDPHLTFAAIHPEFVGAH